MIRITTWNLKQTISKDIRDKKARLQELFDEKESMTGEYQELTKQKAKLELNIKDLQEELDGDSSSKVGIYRMKFNYIDHIISRSVPVKNCCIWFLRQQGSSYEALKINHV